MGPSLKPYPSLGQMRNGVFKIKCFGQKMRKCFRSVPHFPRQIVRDVPPPPRKSCHTLGKVMHLSMLSPRVGGGGRADPGDFDIFMEARVKFPTPEHLVNVKFPHPLGKQNVNMNNNWHPACIFVESRI